MGRVFAANPAALAPSRRNRHVTMNCHLVCVLVGLACAAPDALIPKESGMPAEAVPMILSLGQLANQLREIEPALELLRPSNPTSSILGLLDSSGNPVIDKYVAAWVMTIASGGMASVAIAFFFFVKCVLWIFGRESGEGAWVPLSLASPVLLAAISLLALPIISVMYMIPALATAVQREMDAFKNTVHLDSEALQAVNPYRNTADTYSLESNGTAPNTSTTNITLAEISGN
eukprot:c47794_g1_i1.p1 GENE.c47794_g1_i1~~c47794_g1_i1.p1  ORF type:complete len:232 (+),score=26.75 c47794_g1_i1:424-1119(+)